jgi:hypothetical protein
MTARMIVDLLHARWPPKASEWAMRPRAWPFEAVWKCVSHSIAPCRTAQFRCAARRAYRAWTDCARAGEILEALAFYYPFKVSQQPEAERHTEDSKERWVN